MRPIIGITVDIEEINGKSYLYADTRYGELVEACGGIPLLIHPTHHVRGILDKIDGLILSGGEDIHPKYYGEELLHPLELSPDSRSDFEKTIFKEALVAKIPTLGICHGMQLMNLALGGTLYQDIGCQLSGAFNHRLGDGRHEIIVIKGTTLSGIIESSRAEVTSTHHQAVKELGQGLVVCASADDGIVEAIEIPGHPYLIGVQWHPEKMTDDLSKRLFSEFIRACK